MRRIALPLICACALSALSWASSAQDLPGFLRRIVPNLNLPGTQPEPARQQAQPQQQVRQPGMFGDTSIEEEIAIGRQLAGNLLGAAPLLKNDVVQAYVNRVGRWVALHSARPDLNWHFGVLDTPTLNAFAMPGGYVFLTRGLYETLASEAELAGVLAHEIGHVTAGHHLKVFKQSSMLGAVSGLVSQALAQSRGNNQMVQNLIGNGAEALARGLDKDAEYEADRIGVVLAARAGYEPYGLPSVLQRIGRVNPKDSSVALLFKTHPSPADRLEHLGDAMGMNFERYAANRANAERFLATLKR